MTQNVTQRIRCAYPVTFVTLIVEIKIFLYLAFYFKKRQLNLDVISANITLTLPCTRCRLPPLRMSLLFAVVLASKRLQRIIRHCGVTNGKRVLAVTNSDL